MPVLQAHVAQLLAVCPALPSRLLQPRVIGLRGVDAAAIERAVVQLEAEFLGTQPWRSLAIDAALCTLLARPGPLGHGLTRGLQAARAWSTCA